MADSHLQGGPYLQPIVSYTPGIRKGMPLSDLAARRPALRIGRCLGLVDGHSHEKKTVCTDSKVEESQLVMITNARYMASWRNTWAITMTIIPRIDLKTACPRDGMKLVCRICRTKESPVLENLYNSTAKWYCNAYRRYRHQSEKWFDHYNQKSGVCQVTFKCSAIAGKNGDAKNQQKKRHKKKEARLTEGEGMAATDLHSL